VEEITGTLASGNRYRVTPASVEITSPTGELLKHSSVRDMIGVTRDGSQVRIGEFGGELFELETASPDDAAQIHQLLMRTVPAMHTTLVQKRSRLNYAVWIAVAVFGFIAIGAYGMSDGFESTRNTSRVVVYRVTDTSGGAVSLTYENSGGNTQQISDAATPWEKRYTMDRGDFVYISAQRGHNSGTVRCTITVDGEVIERAESSGAAVIATCSGRVP